MNGVQVRNLYYVKRTAKASEHDPELGALPGDLQIVDFGAATKNALSGKDGIQLKYTNPDGKIIVSDFIVKGQAAVESVAGTTTPLKAAVLELESAPIAGEDYIVNILVHNYQSLSDNSTLTKFGAVHAKTGMTTHEFMWRMAKSFVMNFRRDEAVNKFFTFHIGKIADHKVNASTLAEVTFDSAKPAAWDNSAEYALVVLEVEQPTYIRGTFPKQTVSFDIAPHTVIEDGDEIQPFVTADEESGIIAIVPQDAVLGASKGAVVPNGYAMADLEYLCHGEIGDQIREADGVRAIRTKYAISDADLTKTFDTVEIVFHYVGRNTSSQKAEKQITLAVDHAGSVSASTLASTIAAKL